MHLKAVLLATLAAAFFLTACGGGGDSGDGGSTPASQPQQSPPASEPPQSPPASEPQQLPPTSEPQQLSPAICQPQTIVGGALFVAEQAPVGVTLLSNGGLLTQYFFEFMYDNVFGIPTNNRQDKWGDVLLFPPGTPVGTSTQVQLHPYPFVNGEQTPSTFPRGIPVELSLIINDGNQAGPANHSTTASIGKDIPHDGPLTASVTYGANNTATVTFFPSGSGAHFSVGLTNVLGPTGSGGGC
jgi:hypothetical protein